MKQRRLLAVLMGAAASLMVLAAPATGAPDTNVPDKSVPAPPNAWKPGDKPIGAAKPKRLAGEDVQPLDAFTLTLNASATRLWPRQYSNLTATTNQDVGPTPYYILIYQWGPESDGQYHNRLVAACGSGTTCSASVVQNMVATNSYVAYVARYSATEPPPEVQVASPPYGNRMEISWHTTGIGLFASANTVGIGGATTIYATTGDDVGPSPFYITLFDETTRTRIAVCGIGQRCEAVVSHAEATTHKYASFVSDNSTAFPPTGVISASAPTWVTWSNSGWQVSLTAPDRVYGGGAWTYGTVTATVNRDLGPTPYYIRIFNIGTGELIASCGTGTTCSVNARMDQGWTSHVAFVSVGNTGMPPADTQASSNAAHTDYQRVG